MSAVRAGLNASEAVYTTHGRRPRTVLRFSVSGTPAIERAYWTHWVSPRLRAAKRERRRAAAAPPG